MPGASAKLLSKGEIIVAHEGGENNKRPDPAPESKSPMPRLDLVSLVVRDYDPAIRFFVDVLGFELVEDHPSLTTDGRPKRWVVVRPPGASTGILLARADGDEQAAIVGRQFAGRVGLFLRVEDFAATFARMQAAGVRFVRPPRDEAYGTVAVFADCEGNHWDLLGPKARRATPRQVVQAWVEGFNRADVEVLVALYHDDAVNHQVARDPVEGREAIRAMFKREFAAANMVCIPENVFEDGEWAVLEWRDPKGLRGCGFFHVIDGKIAFQRGYWDRLTFQRLYSPTAT